MPATLLPVRKKRDQLTERVLGYIRGLLGDMTAKELARRSKAPYWRVQRFLDGQLPFPPLDFLTALLGVWGQTLADALTATSPPAPAPPALSGRVRAIAQRMNDLDDDALQLVGSWIDVLKPTAKRPSPPTDGSARGRAAAKRESSGSGRAQRGRGSRRA